MHRLFVAIDLPKNIKDKVLGICFGVPGAKWMEENQMHLTLRFIGDVPGNQFGDIETILEQVNTPSFPLTIKGVGHFPPRKNPKILWAGVEKNEKLLQLKKKIDSLLCKIGLGPDDRKFHSHITLARLKNTPNNRVGHYFVENGLFNCEPFLVNEFHLFSSILGRNGAIHTKEFTYPLQDSTH